MTAIWSVPRLAVSVGQFLVQNVSAPLEFVGFTKEDSTYTGACCRLVRNDNNAEQDIGWNGKNVDAAAAATFLSGTTGLIKTMYGQRLIADLTQAIKANMPAYSLEADGLPYIGAGASKWLESASLAWKTAKVHCFIVAKRDYLKASDQLKPNACLFAYGSGAYDTTARFGLASDSNNYAPEFPRNGAIDLFEAQANGFPGEAYYGNWSVHDVNCNTKEYRIGKTVLYSGIATADITYPATTKIVLGNDGSNTHPWPSKGIRAFAFYDAAQSSIVRNQITDHLAAQTGLGVVTLPATITSSGASGFNFTPVYVPGYFGAQPADTKGIIWGSQHAGYPWSHAVANNVNNGTDLVRFELRGDDADNYVTNANRSERAANNRTMVPGQTGWMTASYYIEACPTQVNVGSDWSYIFQMHYDDATASAFTPDGFAMGMNAGVLKFVSQRVGATIQHGADQTINIGQWRHLVVKLTWAASRSSSGDKFEVWEGPHGTTLIKVADDSVGGNYFDTAAINIYLKGGWYRGETFPRLDSPVSILIANHDMSTAANAFLSHITTQPALPTHA